MVCENTCNIFLNFVSMSTLYKMYKPFNYSMPNSPKPFLMFRKIVVPMEAAIEATHIYLVIPN